MYEALGISRPVLREAISRLKYDGLIESFQGRGVFVCTESGTTVFRLDPPNLINKAELEHILGLLIAAEVAATSMAAERCSKRYLTIIKRAVALYPPSSPLPSILRPTPSFYPSTRRAKSRLWTAPSRAFP